ncbi:MAG: PD-(D/E)XK nuclease family protein [Helicobacteraceae bacterium]|jgi:RecB family exonuclease|nr:PD-(D/E)XK nuclease family protein [Helicobacteraceae bacterium]
MPVELLVVPTSRARRDRFANVTGLAPKILTIKEFEERIAYAPKRAVIGDVGRRLALTTASERLKNAEKLGVSDEFLVFLDHAPFFLKLFDEMSQYGAEPNDLLSGDSYAEYDEHIAVLTELQGLYGEELDKAAYADRGYIAKNRALNLGWLKEFNALTITIEGVPTPFEVKLFEAAAEVLPLTISICPAPFDGALKTALSPLADRADIQETALELTDNFRLFSVGERVEQAFAIASEVFRYLDLGVEPEKIAVALPDESFASILRRFDRYDLFNFAMGAPFGESRFCRTLRALLRYDDDKAAKTYIDRKQIDFGELDALLALAESDAEKEIAKEALQELSPILTTRNLTRREKLGLFVQILESKSIDDNRGGKITVLGALETRAVCFDAVIAVDFNDNIVPRRSQKDLFLNAAVRARAGLPAYSDREDNERSLYWRLFARARYKTILCTQNDKREPSRFIKELGAKDEPKVYPLDRKLFSARTSLGVFTPKEIKTPFSQNSLSPSKLKSYITCKRQFYHKYVERLKPDEPIGGASEARKMGAALHEVLAEIAREKTDVERLRETIASKLRQKTEGDERLSFDALIWARKIEPFYENEKRRFKEGWKTAETEREASAVFRGVTLNGRIDRLDLNNDRAEILDYKSGAVPVFANRAEDQTDFQLTIYRELAVAAGYADKRISAGYYSLESGKISYIDFEKYEETFAAHIKAFKSPNQSFDLAPSRKPCAYCDYAALCGRR